MAPIFPIPTSGPLASARSVKQSPGRQVAQRRLERWTAVLVLFGCLIGWLMVAVPFGHLFARFLAYELHQTIGIIVFVLLAVRLFLGARALRMRPDERIAPWRRLVTTGMRALSCTLLAVIPILGYLTAATSRGQVSTFFLGPIWISSIVGADSAWFPIFKLLHRSLANLLVFLGSANAIVAVYQRLRS